MVDSNEVESPKEDPTAEEWSCGFVVVAVTGFFRWRLWYMCPQPTRQSGVGTTLLQLQTKRHYDLGTPLDCPSQRSHFVHFYFHYYNYFIGCCPPCHLFLSRLSYSSSLVSLLSVNLSFFFFFFVGIMA